MNSKKWKFDEHILGHYINSSSSKTFQDAGILKEKSSWIRTI